MIRSTKEATVVWFQLDVRPTHKITWPIELYLLYAKTARTEAELRCQLWDKGEISELTEQDRLELPLLAPHLMAKAAKAGSTGAKP